MMNIPLYKEVQHDKLMAERLRFDVEPSMLNWAVHRSSRTVDELAGKKATKNIREWLEGTSKPTRPQLEAFAKATYTPFGYLLLPEPPDEPEIIPHYRTKKGSNPHEPSINLKDTINIIKRRQDWLRTYLIAEGFKPLSFVGSLGLDDDPVKVADDMRTTLQLAPDWASTHRDWKAAQKHLCKKTEDTGILLSVNSVVGSNNKRPLDRDEFRGFVLVDDHAPFMFINAKDFAGAQMFTLAHELAHVWMGESASFDLTKLASNSHIKLERVCNRIAAEFLVPTKDIIELWADFTTSSKGPYKAASRHFKVSELVVAYRALNTKCITKEEFDMQYAESERRHEEEIEKHKNTKGGPDPYIYVPDRISRRFLKTTMVAVKRRKLLYREAYYLTGLKAKSFDTMRRNMRGGKL